MKEKRTLIAIFVIALALRLLYAVSLHIEIHTVASPNGSDEEIQISWKRGDPQGPDAPMYDLLARNLLQRKTYVVPAIFGKELLAFRPPLLSFLLAGIYSVFGHSYFAAEVVLCLISSGTCLLMYGMSSELFGRRAGLFSAMLSVIYPSFIYYSSTICTETLYTFCLVGAMWLLLRAGPDFRSPQKWAAAGIAFGFGVLARTQLVAFLPMILVWALISFPRKLPALYGWVLCVALALFTMMPWLLRNYLMLGSAVLTTDGGYTFWSGNHPGSTGGGETFIPANPSRFARLPEIEMDREFLRAGFEFVYQNPPRFRNLVFLRLWNLWRPFPHADHVGFGKSVVGGIEFIVVLGLGICGAFVQRSRWRVLLLFILLFVCMSAVHMVFMSVTRYRIPLMPFFMVFAGAALACLAGKKSNSP